MNGKKIAIALAIVVYLVFSFFAVQFAAGLAYYVANKTMPENIELDTFQKYWTYYSDDPVQRKRLQFAGGISVFLVYVLPVLIMSSLGNTRRSLHGDARFATAQEVRESGLYSDKGIIVGKYQGQYLVYTGQEFVLLAAPTRSGKGVAVIIPNLLHWHDSCVVLDIKLENFKLTSGFRRAHGQEVYLFSPFSEDGKTHRWNPLDLISRDRNFQIGDTLSIAQILYPSGDPKNEFWNEQARNLFLGLTLYLLETPELPCTFGELLRQSSGKGMPLKEYLQGVMVERTNSETPLSDACLDALNRFCSTSENTLTSVMATFNGPLTIFANPIVDAATSGSDFDVRDVRKKRMSIYIGIQPNRLRDAALLVNLFFSQLVNLNTQELPQNNPALKYQCLLIMDEFTSIGKVGILASAVSYIAGYNLRLLTIIQSIAQFESVYGDKETRNYVTNHSLQVVYPPREQKDANEYSEMLGYMTEKGLSTSVSRPRAWGGGGSGSNSESTSDQRRALLLPQELKELGRDKEIVLLENTKPILCDKARYFSDNVFMDRLRALSPTLQKCAKKQTFGGFRLPTQKELEEAAFVNNELSAPIPKQDIELHLAKIERRVRPVRDDEQIDIAKLAMDVADLPALDDPAAPSAESVNQLVDSFFSQLHWTNVSDGDGEDDSATDIGSAPENELEVVGKEVFGGSIEPAENQNAKAPAFDDGPIMFELDAPPPPARGTVVTPGGELIDLAVLDA